MPAQHFNGLRLFAYLAIAIVLAAQASCTTAGQPASTSDRSPSPPGPTETLSPATSTPEARPTATHVGEPPDVPPPTTPAPTAVRPTSMPYEESSPGAAHAIALQSDGKVLIGGSFTQYGGVTRNNLVRLNPDGSLDTTFDPGAGTHGEVSAIVVQSDGRLLIGGSFTEYGGAPRAGIARLNPNGSLDTAFDPGDGATGGQYSDQVSTIAVQSDGKVLIGGSFTQYDGVPRNQIARLNPDGSLDTAFDLGLSVTDFVSTIVVQSDGKILVGGQVSTIHNDAYFSSIIRINPDGSLDPIFHPWAGGDRVNTIAVQSDGKLLVGGFLGYFLRDNVHPDDLRDPLVAAGRAGIARLNPDGSLDATFDPGQWVDARDGNWQWWDVRAIAVQRDGRVLVVGDFTLLSMHPATVERSILTRLYSDGTLDTIFDVSGRTQAIAMQTDGKVLVGGMLTHYNHRPRHLAARFNPDGSLDPAFDPGTETNGDVSAVALQSDGRVLIGGGFTNYENVQRNRITRLNPDSSLDVTFDPGAGVAGDGRSEVSEMIVQSDGKVLIGGTFTGYNGTVRNNLARLHPDGSLDTTFVPAIDAGVCAIAVQGDGKMFVSDRFTLARLNPDGSLDATFDARRIYQEWSGSSLQDVGVCAIAVQSDGKVLIGGSFSHYDDVPRSSIARLNPDGSLDTTFDPGAGLEMYVELPAVHAIVVQDDGKAIIAGRFSGYDGVKRWTLARLNLDGSLDPSFEPDWGPSFVEGAAAVSAIALQSDGKVLIGGIFTQYNDMHRGSIARLNPDGSLDTTFDPGAGANNPVTSLAVQSDGKVIIGGEFTKYDGVARNRIARLNPDGSLDITFNPGGD